MTTYPPGLPPPLPLSPRNSELNALEQRGYLIGKKVGQGSYATVHIAEYVDAAANRKMRLACKIFDKEKAPRDFLDKFFPRELEILTKIENPHIIQVHSILQRGPRVFIFMRFADNGDLLDFVKSKGAVPEPQCKLWFRQMTSGLHYLHSKNIAHRDLKCENILLSRRFNVKLADFGFARYCVDGEGRRVLSQTYCGSAAYAAPEVVSGTPYNPKLADVWSLGIILFIMLNASMPFDDSNLRKLLKDQMNRNWMFRSRVRDSVSAMAKAIVRHLLEPDITQRLTLERVMALEWVRSRKPPSAAKLPAPATPSAPGHASSPSLPRPSTMSGVKTNDPKCSDAAETTVASKHRKSTISKSTGATPAAPITPALPVPANCST
jgi:serine kinase